VRVRARSLSAHEAADREVVGSIRAFEETEPLSVRPLFWREMARPRRNHSSAHTDWVVFLIQREVLADEVQWRSRLAEAYGVAVVPRWVNDLCCALRTSMRVYVSGSLLNMTPEQEEAVRLVSRAVRSAQRAPAFRISLTAKCRELRAAMAVKGDLASVEQAPAAEVFGKVLLIWLREHDWSDARPGSLLR
jgi:hypothetical protein